MTLRWQQDSLNAHWAIQGQRQIGLVVKNRAGKFTYEIPAVHTKWIAKGYGEVASLESGKRAIEKAWQKWLDAYGLRAKGQ